MIAPKTACKTACKTAPKTPLRLAAAALLATTCLAFHPADAQIPSPQQDIGTPHGPVVDTPLKPRAPREQPPALPGALSSKNEAAPAQKSAADMSPNDAMFDAINRGDIDGVRDAVNRGAEITARNVIGLTPIELSVDLGHNDITFLLLSQRGSIAGEQAAPPPGAPQAGALTARTASARAGRAAPPPRPTTVAAEGVVSQAPAPVTPTGRRGAAPSPASATLSATTAYAAPTDKQAALPPRQYAGSGGTPIPQMGFLGFGGAAR